MKRTQPISYENFTYPIKRNRSYPMEAQIPYETKRPYPMEAPIYNRLLSHYLVQWSPTPLPPLNMSQKTVFFLNINPSPFRPPPPTLANSLKNFSVLSGPLLPLCTNLFCLLSGSGSPSSGSTSLPTN